MREWIVTNGLGGYASLTTSHDTTRKFHGLLIASLNPPIDRWVFVSNCFDQLTTNDQTISLNPSRAIMDFSYFPRLTYSNELGMVQKTFLMQYHHNTTLIRYDIFPKQPVKIRHYPVLTSRHFYQVHAEPSLFDVSITNDHEKVMFSPTNTDQEITLWKPEQFTYNPDYKWEYKQYNIDHKRNDSSEDHLLQTGYLEGEIQYPTTYYLIFSLESASLDPAEVYRQEIKRKQQLLDKADLPSDISPLLLSSDLFLVKKNNTSTILAGYHWFSDWGRDTLIALPGLTLTTKRYDQARDILQGLCQTCHHGIIPNTYDDKTGEAAYNTVDASLWFIDRVYQYMKYTDDLDFLQTIYPTLTSIISSYKHGTINNIHMGHDSLIAHGPGLTWMDVKHGHHYPTPRQQKAVEIQALWYHDLCVMDHFSHMFDDSQEYGQLADTVKHSFLEQYDQLYDVIDTKDASCRPNMLFLVSLDNQMIDLATQKDIVDTVNTRLLTVFGPRTVSPDHPAYKGTYFGPYPRDLTYHNGMVWPWLLGPFITAFLKTQNYSENAKKHAFDRFLQPMFDVYGEQWDGCIHEIFDGDPVYVPRGCINQAWSVAEPLRAYVEDICYIRPDYEEKYHLNKVRI